jgi:hypothetical protein
MTAYTMFSSNLNTLSAFSLMSYLSSHSSSPPAEGAGGKPNLKNILQLPLTIRCRDGKSPQLNSVLQLPLSPRRRGWGQEPKNILQLPLTIRCRDGKSPQLNSILQLPLSSGEGAGGKNLKISSNSPSPSGAVTESHHNLTASFNSPSPPERGQGVRPIPSFRYQQDVFLSTKILLLLIPSGHAEGKPRNSAFLVATNNL